MKKTYLVFALALGVLLGVAIDHPSEVSSRTTGLQIVGNCITRPDVPGPGLCQNAQGYWGIGTDNPLVQLHVQQHSDAQYGSSEIAMCKDVPGVNGQNCIVMAIHSPDDIGGGLENKAYLALTGGASAKELQIRASPDNGFITFQSGCDTNGCMVLTLRGAK